MGIKLTKEEFIERAVKVHEDKYDYSLVEYINNRTKVNISCKKHNNSFSQLPSTHLQGANGCTVCYTEEMSKIKSLPDTYYLNKLEELGINKDNVLKIKNGDNIKISCSKHGEYTTSFTLIRRSKNKNCPMCMAENKTQGIKKDTDSFKACAKIVHNEGFNYDNVTYVNHKTEINITCNTCSYNFNQSPSTHLAGKGCPNCWSNKNKNERIANRISVEEVDKRCNVLFNNTLDFSDSDCVTSNNKMKVFCKKCNSNFEQYKGHLLRGVGCQKCSKEEKESKPEKFITKILLENKIVFYKEHSFDDCIYKNKLRFDFYIPDLNMCIEYQGQQHYKPIEIFGGDKAFNLQLRKDNIKREYCRNNGIRLVEITYSDNIEDILKTECFTQYKI